MSWTPAFLRRLEADDVRTVLLAGCGGGFDFVHALMLWPGLRRLGKRVLVHSYSFGDPERIEGAPAVYTNGDAVVRRAHARCVPAANYGPEVHAASFLDLQRPADAPHAVLASYARSWTVPALTAFYQELVQAHAIDAVVLVDGGSDALMRGDEEGLGDPIEDAVSIASVAALTRPKVKLLISAGLGVDRFNHVSDAATLRAVAELTAAGGYLGTLGIEPDGELATFYRGLLDHLDRRHSFRSVVAGSIAASIGGAFGADAVPSGLHSRVEPGDVYLWPLMAMLVGFEVDVVARRSLLAGWVRDQTSVRGCYAAVERGRAGIVTRPVEELPVHAAFRNPRGRFM
jgi:hypothetical protein